MPPAKLPAKLAVMPTKSRLLSRLPQRLCLSTEHVPTAAVKLSHSHAPSHSSRDLPRCVSPAQKEPPHGKRCTSPALKSPDWLPPSPSPSWPDDPYRFVYKRPHTPDRAWSTESLNNENNDQKSVQKCENLSLL